MVLQNIFKFINVVFIYWIRVHWVKGCVQPITNHIDSNQSNLQNIYNEIKHYQLWNDIQKKQYHM